MLVDTVFDLQNVRNNLAGHYALGGDVDATPTNSWNGGAGFAPIGSEANAFTGSFDGRGHRVAGLTINDAADASVGFFGTNAGQVSNVNLLAVAVSGGAASSSVGALAGVNAGEVTDVNVTGVVSGGGDDSNIGGLVGYNRTGIDTASAAVNVIATGSNSAAGGLVGYNMPFLDRTGDNPGYAEIAYSHASGAVTGPGGSLGGLVGVNDGYTGMPMLRYGSGYSDV